MHVKGALAGFSVKKTEKSPPATRIFSKLENAHHNWSAASRAQKKRQTKTDVQRILLSIILSEAVSLTWPAASPNTESFSQRVLS